MMRWPIRLERTLPTRNGLKSQVSSASAAIATASATKPGQRSREGLIRVARDAENAGVNLALELLNSKVDHPDYQADHTEWGLKVCRSVGSPRVKLLYDIYTSRK